VAAGILLTSVPLWFFPASIKSYDTTSQPRDDEDPVHTMTTDDRPCSTTQQSATSQPERQTRRALNVDTDRPQMSCAGAWTEIKGLNKYTI